MPKLYESKAWLQRRYIIDKLSMVEIAKMCNTTEMTISRWIKKHGLK